MAAAAQARIIPDPISDQQRMLEVGISVRPYDVWMFAGCDPRFGQDGYPGRVPGQLIANLLYYFTELDDLVLDPMCGGGTTIDVATAMGRRVLGYDIAPCRDDINAWDILRGLPVKPDGVEASLIFLDPPYFRKKKYSHGSISDLSRADYLSVFGHIARDGLTWLSARGKIALLMSDFTPAFDGSQPDTIWLWDYIEEFGSAGFEVERRIQCPLTTQQLHPSHVAQFIRDKKLARLGRDLIIFRRGSP